MMKRAKKLFFIATITVGGCLYSGFVLSNNAHHTKREVSIGLKKVNKDNVAIYIEESVTGNFDANNNGYLDMSPSLYALIIHFAKIQSRFFSELAKKLQLLKYYGIGQYIIFKENMKKILLHVAKAW